MVLVLDSNNFESEILQKGKSALVDFFAQWCGPCKMMSPIVDKISEEFKDKIVVGKVDVDENRSLSEKYGIMSIPTLILFKDGEIKHKEVGAISEEKIRDLIKENLL